ncbi:MAG: hypothetical protein GC189_09465 [Alphaproteobacteria bacterium]|nr:hypothetical protein [Alphaproteobacteria bacterium]
MNDPNFDNVTPFRRRRPAPRKGGGMGWKSHRGKALMAHGLTLGAFAIYFFFPAPPISYLGLAVGIAAVAIAAGNRDDGMPWARTHHEHVLRTLIIGAAVWTLSSLLLLFGSGFLSFVVWTRIAVCVWVLIRSGVGLILASLRKPIPHPRGALL